MKKHLLFITLCCILSIATKAQNTAPLTLYKAVHQKEVLQNESIEVLIQGDVETIKQLVAAEGGKFQYAAGDIAKVNLPLQSIDNVMSNKAVLRLETVAHTARPLNDTMLKNNNILAVLAGVAPLTQGYDGNGIVVGFIDTGIDFTHPDFQDSTHHSRVKYLWDHNLTGAAPSGFTYGAEFTNSDIDAGLASASNDLASAGHGTHVAGVAVGNGLASGMYKGAAPKADIIMVALNFYSNQSSILDGVNYIYAKALAMGKPCVINISVGGQLGGIGNTYGSHDGKDLEAQMINNLMNAHYGRALVAAAGNDGNNPIHLGYSVTADTNFTLFYIPSGYIGNDMQLYGSAANMANVHFSIGAVQLSPTYTNLGRIHFSSILPLNVLRNDTLYYGGNRVALIQSITSVPSTGNYEIEFVVQADTTFAGWQTLDWRLFTTGNGSFDLWSYDMVNGGLPPASVMTDSVYCKLPDTHKTICSSFQCLDNVVTVGNYTNRRSYQDYFNTLYVDTTKVPGLIHPTSSQGPTRDGRTKPDVAAPGDMTMAAVVLSIIPSITCCYGDALSLDSVHVRDGGTSHAAPSVAGIAALYLQKNPTATASQVRTAIDNCTTVDDFTGMVPNNLYGHGKANAFGALTNCAVGTTSISESTKNDLVIYPNPSSQGTVVNLAVSNYKSSDKVELRIYNAVGEFVKSINVNNHTVQLNNTLKAGVYFCNLLVNGNKVVTQKLIIL